MNTPRIRRATRNDRSAWSAMRTDLWPETDDAHLAEIDAYFSGTSIDIVEVLIVESASAAVGFLELNIRDFAEGSRNARVPYVEAWYVAPRHRGKGFGALLMQAAERWATDKGYSELASDTELDNTHSIALHGHLGFVETERLVCFLKKLKDS